jgi:hypothetical protein
MPAWIGPEASQYGSGTWRSPGYRSARIRGRWCKLLFVLVAIVAAVAVVMCLQGIGYAADGAAGFARMTSTEIKAWVTGAAGSEGWVFILAFGLAIAFPVWFSRSVDNLPPLAGGTPRHSPNEAIGWWFVPIANLFVPFMMAREAWYRYATPSRNSNNWVLVAWWLTYNAGFTLGFVSTSMVFGRVEDGLTISQFVDRLQTGLMLGVLGYALIAVAAVLGFYIVNEIGHRAEERSARFGLDAPGPRWAGQPAYPGYPVYPGQAYPGQAYPPNPAAGSPPPYPQPYPPTYPDASTQPPAPPPAPPTSPPTAPGGDTTDASANSSLKDGPA